MVATAFALEGVCEHALPYLSGGGGKTKGNTSYLCMNKKTVSSQRKISNTSETSNQKTTHYFTCASDFLKYKFRLFVFFHFF